MSNRLCNFRIESTSDYRISRGEPSCRLSKDQKKMESMSPARHGKPASVYNPWTAKSHSHLEFISLIFFSPNSSRGETLSLDSVPED
jgi:hypothetical protein